MLEVGYIIRAEGGWNIKLERVEAALVFDCRGGRGELDMWPFALTTAAAA